MQETLEKNLVEFFETAKIKEIGVDLYLNNKFIKEKIQETLTFHNKFLVKIDSDNVDWEHMNEKHEFYGIKKALLANMWIASKGQNLNVQSSTFKNILFVILKKLKNNPENESFDTLEKITLANPMDHSESIENFSIKSPRNNTENKNSPKKDDEIFDIEEKLSKGVPTPEFSEFAKKSDREISKLTSLSNSFLSETKNLVYSESSFIDTKEKNNAAVEEKINFSMLIEATEMLKAKFDSSLETWNEKIENLTKIIENHSESLGKYEEKEKNSEGKNKFFQEKVIELEKKINEKEKEIEELNDMYGNKFNELYKLVESKTNGQNERIEKNSEKFDVEYLKEIELKFEKLQYFVKNNMKKTSQMMCKKSEFDDINSKFDFLNEQFYKIIDEFHLIQERVGKSEEEKDFYTKSQQNFSRICNENDKNLKEALCKYDLLSEKLENNLKFKEIFKSRNEELMQKISEIEFQLMEMKESLKNSEIRLDLMKTDLKVNNLEENYHKLQILPSEIYSINSLINDLQQKTENFEIELRKIVNPHHDSSLELSIHEFEPEKAVFSYPIKLDYSKTLENRLEKLEKINIHKKAFEISKNSEDLINFIPGETENLVRSAVLEKVNQFAMEKRNHFGYKTLAPFSPSHTFSSYEEDILPSAELRENLKIRGIQLGLNKN